jgi:regulatory protein
VEDSPADADPKPQRRNARELSATQRALGLLTRREHSRKELTRKLTSRGMDAAEVETAVEKLSSDGWQNDARFAETLVRVRSSGGYGPVRIRVELATHGLDRDAIAAALATFCGDWAEIASDLVRRRFGPVAALDLNQRRKAADFLMRRGFESGAVRAATCVSCAERD